jgi:hypothetical protein
VEIWGWKKARISPRSRAVATLVGEVVARRHAGAHGLGVGADGSRAVALGLDEGERGGLQEMLARGDGQARGKREAHRDGQVDVEAADGHGLAERALDAAGELDRGLEVEAAHGRQGHGEGRPVEPRGHVRLAERLVEAPGGDDEDAVERGAVVTLL